MNTKTIILGENTIHTDKKKPIQLDIILMDDGKLNSNAAGSKPSHFKYIELVCKNYGVLADGTTFDLIFAYQDPNNRTKCSGLYLGKWNDGVVD